MHNAEMHLLGKWAIYLFIERQSKKPKENNVVADIIKSMRDLVHFENGNVLTEFVYITFD